MPKPTPFVLNDETQENSYGFIIPNDGIALDQFESNPVMLNSHNNDTDNVIGKWNNVRVTASQLLADPEFDSEDPDAAKVAGKVERGFLKGASMGVGFFIDDLIYVAGKLILSKCVLKEASIVAVPSNAKALRLYDLATGKLFTKETLELQLSALTQNQQIENKKASMKQIMLSAAAMVALCLTAQPETSEVLDASILKLKGELETEKAKGIAAAGKVTELEKKLSDHVEMQNKAVLDSAITDGKITTEERATFAALPFDTLVVTLAKIPAKQVLGDKVIPLAANGAKEPATFEELMKLSDTDKTLFKVASPEKYKALLNA